MTAITNLGIAGAGLATAGGLIGGGYFMLKNDPKPVSKLLEIRKRQLLEKGKDDAEWKIAWELYKKANTEIVTEAEKDPAPEPKKAKPPVTKKVVKVTDIWNLSDWKNEESYLAKVPESFKETCTKKSQEKQNGIWTFEYKQFEEFCTKASPSDEE